MFQEVAEISAISENTFPDNIFNAIQYTEQLLALDISLTNGLLLTNALHISWINIEECLEFQITSYPIQVNSKGILQLIDNHYETVELFILVDNVRYLTSKLIPNLKPDLWDADFQILPYNGLQSSGKISGTLYSVFT